MPWAVSNGGGSGYAWSGLNKYNQHAAKITLPSNCAVTQLRVIAAGYNTGTVATRLAIWNVGGSVRGQSASFNMSDGSESTQYTYTKSISSVVLSSGNYWVGLYRHPSESHIMQTTSGSGDGYRKTNTSSWANISSMSGYNTDGNDEPTVGAFYITAPYTPTSCSVSRNSDTSQTISWNRTANADRPISGFKLYRYDNITGSYYLKKTITGTWTTNGSNSYTDTTTTANRYYKYKVYAYNDAGNSSYSNEDDIRTTPTAPSYVTATRISGNVNITWHDNAASEQYYKVQRKTSSDGISWSSYSTLTSTLAANSTNYLDTSPANYNYYKISALCTSPSLESAQVESNQVVILQAPDAPTALNPDSGNVFDASFNAYFFWQHNPKDSTAQTKFSLQYRIVGAGSWTALYTEEVTSNNYTLVPGSTFVNGNDYEWQVKTWGDYATGSAWSSSATFTTSTEPVVTIVDPNDVDKYEYSTLTVEWTYTQAESENQTQYIATLYDVDYNQLEEKLVSSSIASGNNDTCTFNYILENNTTYNVGVTAKSAEGLWSVYTDTEFTTEFLQPTKPSIALELDEEIGSINVEITNPDVVTEYEEQSSGDTYIDSDWVGSNYNGVGYIITENNTGTGTTIRHILLNFDLSFFIGKTVVASELTLYRSVILTPGIDSRVNYIKSSWDETTVTYSSIPTLDSTGHNEHTHTSGDSEKWDVSALVSDIADGTITDYEGMAIVATTTDGSTDRFYDSSNPGYEPVLYVEIEPENAETDHNVLYRSVNGGTWEVVENNIPKNTIVTDYIPNVGGNNNYYVEAVSAAPASMASDAADLDAELFGMFFLNGGNGYEKVVKLIGDISINEQINRDETIKQYAGRTYPVKYQGDNKIQKISFSADCPVEKYHDLVDILESVGNVFYRDWRGRWFLALLSESKFTTKAPQAYQFNTNITRLEGET